MQQQKLALEDDDVAERSQLMQTLDGLNLRYGRGTVSMASAGLAGDRRNMHPVKSVPASTYQSDSAQKRHTEFHELLMHV